MSDTKHEIQLALRIAAGHENAARKAEESGAKQYEMKMKSAGASAYSAFSLAIKSAPEYAGRKIDDAAIRRIYSSTKPRPWWDKHLAGVKVEGKPADREWAKRVIQWHIDPAAAASRRALATVRRLANHRKAKENPAARGGRPPQVRPGGGAPSTAEMRGIASAATTTALAGRPEPTLYEATRPTELAALQGEAYRILRALPKVKAAERDAVLEILRTTAREVEEYVS